MSRLEELARKHFPPDSNTAQIQHEKALAFGRELLEEAARKASEIGDRYSNTSDGSRAAVDICRAIRSLAETGERRGDGEA